MPLDANEAPEQSWAQNSSGHCHWALILLPPGSSVSGELLGVYNLKSQHPHWSLHSKGRQKWSNQPSWIPPRASQALLICLWPMKPAMSLLTLPLGVTDSQKSQKKGHSHAQDAQEQPGPAFCWFCRQEGQSQPETCTNHSKQRGRVQHLLKGKFNHLKGTRLQVTAFASSLKIRTCTVSHHKMQSLLPSGTLTAIISSPGNSIGKL